jgi:hypothetical protein
MIRVVACLVSLLVLIGCGNKPTSQQLPESQQEKPSTATVEDAKKDVTVPSGTQVRVRLAETLNTQRNRSGERFTATLDTPVTVNGTAVIPKGTNFAGHITSSSPSGRLKGRAVLGLTLDEFQLNGKTYSIRTTSTSRVSAAHKKRNLALIGGGAGLGAAIGGIAGGGKGALIGAGAGAAAGTAGAAATGQKNVAIPVETPLTFTLKTPVQIKAA